MKKAPSKREFDLEERTAKFGEGVIELCKQVPKTVISLPIINHLIKSTTSVGANYCEADDAESKRDFKHKIGICKKESRESKHFLRMLLTLVPYKKDKIVPLLNEAK